MESSCNLCSVFLWYLSNGFSVSNRFGEESMNRLIRWMQKREIPLDASVLDIGTGNGVFLVELVGTFSIPVSKPNFKVKFLKIWQMKILSL